MSIPTQLKGALWGLLGCALLLAGCTDEKSFAPQQAAATSTTAAPTSSTTSTSLPPTTTTTAAPTSTTTSTRAYQPSVEAVWNGWTEYIARDFVTYLAEESGESVAWQHCVLDETMAAGTPSYVKAHKAEVESIVGPACRHLERGR